MTGPSARPPGGAARPVVELAAELGIPAEGVTTYGRLKAKLDHRLAASGERRDVRYVLVSAVTPTPAGEGKTVHTVGLSMALSALGKRAVCTLRQPSLGPVFGVKGGGAGGGACQLVPLEDVNLHLTGDFHAVGAANNLLAAAVDTSILLDNPHRLDPEKVSWRRVLDTNDRALRQVRIGLGGSRNGIPRDTGFDITAASEVMSILGLSHDLRDLRERLGRIVVGRRFTGRAVTAEDLGAAGSMAALLRDALDPTLVQTSEGTPALVHTGPFANISYGNSSVVADLLAARFADYVVTEAGFGADMGAEKFFNIKCRVSGMRPDVCVVVATVRALKTHSGQFEVKPGRPLPPELLEEDLDALARGIANLEAQLANVRLHGVPCVVALNRHATDTESELALVSDRALEAGAEAVEVSDVYARGSAGGEALARRVVEVAESGKADFRHLYELDASLRDKILELATGLYGAESIVFTPRAQEQLTRLEEGGYGDLPVCVAKTQYSLSHDAALKGRPTGFTFPVREVRLAAGAGFVVPLAGDIATMPGLGREPAYRRIDVDPDGRITGLT